MVLLVQNPAFAASAGVLAGSRNVHPGKQREPAKMAGRLLGRIADDRQVQAAPDHGGDVSEGHALLGDRVIAAPAGAVFEREPIDTRGVEPMHGGPAVKAFADIGRDTLLARHGDEARDKAVVAMAMDRGRKTHH